MMRKRVMVAAWMATGLLAAAPAVAQNVKAGVDAWSRGDYKAAVEQWRGPAVAGDADAQFNLGQAYKLGRGVPTDPGMAESWFRKAAAQGHIQAEDNYGLALFQAGKQSEAVPWLEKSVARGEPRARLVLGTMLFNGDGTRRDYPRAYALMSLASQAGLQSASSTLAQMDQYISPADRERGTALAQQYAAQDRSLAAAGPAPERPGSIRSTAVPPSEVASAAPRPRGTVGTSYGRPPQAAPSDHIVPPRDAPYRQDPRPASPPPPPTREKPRPAPVAAPAPAPAPSGRYRVQLGAFRDRGNAEALWRSVGGRAGAPAIYVPGGGVTRLQAGPYPSKAAAQRACSAIRVTCVVVNP